jgi:hypothetical protein
MAGEPAEWLRQVRRGEIPFPAWWERTLALDAELPAMENDRTLPPSCDARRIESWNIDAPLHHWANHM